MSDSETVEVDLDTFEKDLYSTESDATKDEVSENTPSATNESESEEPEAEDTEVEGDDGDDAAAEQDDQEEAEKPKAKRRRNAQDRIDELTQDKYELKRRIAELEQIAIKGQAQKSEEAPAQAKPVAKDEAPTPDAAKEDGTPLYPLGEFDPKYIADLTRYTIRQENEALKKENAEKAREQQMEAAQQELTKNWETKVQAAAERLPDLPQKFGVLQETFKDIPQEQGNFLASSIMSLENGPDVLSYFADNLDEAKRLMSGGIFETIIALGRLDGEFSLRNKGVEKGTVATKATQAPPPPPVHTKGSAASKTLDPVKNLDDFETLLYGK